MTFSRQFRALAWVTALFTGAWAAVGGLLAIWRGNPKYILIYGALGAISGICTGLAIAQAEAGRRVEEVATRRIAGWGIVGGLVPSVAMGLVWLAFGAPTADYLPLIGFGIVSAGAGGTLAASVAVVAKRAALTAVQDKPKLGAS